MSKSTMKTPNGKSIVVNYRDGRSDWNTLYSCITVDEYRLTSLPVSPGVVIDIGAHIGGCSLLAASLGHKVYAVEVVPENYELLIKNAAENNFDINVFNNAIDKKSGQEINVFLGDTSNESGFHHEFISSCSFENRENSGRVLKATTLSLNDLFKQNNIEYCDVLKIDCEGGEWPAFEGVTIKTLDKINYITGEIHPNAKYQTVDDLLKLLKGKFVDVLQDFDPNNPQLSTLLLKHI